MFIDRRGNESTRRRSEERNSSSASPLQNLSAPPNGAGGGVSSSIYKHVTPNGENPVNEMGTNVTPVPFSRIFLFLMI